MGGCRSRRALQRARLRLRAACGGPRAELPRELSVVLKGQSPGAKGPSPGAVRGAEGPTPGCRGAGAPELSVVLKPPSRRRCPRC